MLLPKFVAMILACCVMGLAGNAFSAEDVQVGRESKVWRILVNRQQTTAPAEMLDLLFRFLQTYPNGVHAFDARFAVAEIYYGQGEFERAASFYQALIDDRDSEYADDARLRMGEMRYNSGDFQGARKQWDKLADRTFGKSLLSAEALYGLALCEMHDQHFLDAVHILDRMIGKYSSYASLAKVRELLGILRYREKNYAEAVHMLQGVNTPVGAFYRGLSYFNQKQYQEAAQAFNGMAQMSSGPFVELGIFLKAECFRMIQNDPLAAEAYDGFVRDFPGSKLRPRAVIYEARALKGQGKLREATSLLDALRSRRNTKEIQNEALSLGAEIAAARGDYRKAMDLISTQAADGGEADQFANVHAILAYYMLKAGKPKEAASVMWQVFQKLPQHPMGIVAQILAGYEASTRGDLKTEISSYENALLKYNYSALSDVAMAMMLNAYFDSGRYQELVTHANRVMSVVDSNYQAQDVRWRSESQLMIAEAYYHLKLYSEASRYYQEAIKEPELANQASLFLGWSRYHEGKYPDALRLGEKLVAVRGSPEEYQASAHLLIASSYFNLKKYNGAVEAFRGFRARYPSDPHVPDTWLYEGWAHREAGDYGDALHAWKTLVAGYPRHFDAQEAQLQIGRLYFQARKYEAAMQSFNKLLTMWPKSSLAADAQWQISQSFYNAKKDAAAIRAYETFLTRYPKDRRTGDAENQLLLTRYRQAYESKNRRLLAEFVRLYPKSTQAPDALYAMGQVAFEAKDWRQAAADFRRLVLDYPAYAQAPLALLAIAHSQERLKNPAAAVAEYKSLVQMFPNHPAALDAAMRMGALYFSMGNYKEAAEGFHFVVERDAPAQVRSSAMYNVAVAYKKQRSFEEAADAFGDFSKAYPEDPKQLDVLMELASINRQLGDTVKAADAYQRVLTLPKLDAVTRLEACNQLGDLYSSSGDKKSAEEAYGRLMSLSPLNHSARLLGLAQLAALYEQEEMWEKALDVYGAIKTSGGKAEWVRSAASRAKEIRAYLQARSAAPASKSDVSIPATAPEPLKPEAAVATPPAPKKSRAVAPVIARKVAARPVPEPSLIGKQSAQSDLKDSVSMEDEEDK